MDVGHMISSLSSAGADRLRADRRQWPQQQQFTGSVNVGVGDATADSVVVAGGASHIDVVVGLWVREVMSVVASCWAATNVARPQLSMIL